MKYYRHGLLLVFFLMQSCSAVGVSTPALQPPTSLPPTFTPEVPVPTAAPSPTHEVPAGYQHYQDAVTGVSIYIPEGWLITNVREGQFAIFQSYSEDKYTGGEDFEAGDTKCDLNVRAGYGGTAALLQKWKSDPTTTIVSEEQIRLDSGQEATRIILENLGQSISVVADINQHTISFTCFGDFTPFDEISVTLNGN